MNGLSWPWLEVALLLPLMGTAWLRRKRDPDVARRHCLFFAGLTLLATLGAWWDFNRLDVTSAAGCWWRPVFGQFLVLDELSVPLLPLTALLHLLTALATLRTKAPRFSFSALLVSEALLLALLSCREPWGIVVLLTLNTLPPWFELRARRKPTGVYSLHMGLFVALLATGWMLVGRDLPANASSEPSLLGVSLLLAAVLLRSGIVPAHCWMTDLFEHATFGTALLFVTPMAGVYATVRLVLPIAPDWALRSIALLSLLTAAYAAGMALVQREARRYFCYLFLSHSSQVLVGLEMVTPIGLTGALCAWLAVSLSLTGFGLTLRSLEARIGRLSLADFHGMYDHVPLLGVLFLLTGLASVGFPGTIGFVAIELLVDGAVQVYPHVGIAVVIASTLNGISVIQVYFRLFTGSRHASSISLGCRLPEKIAVMTLAALVLGGGLYPQPGVASRYHAAVELIRSRRLPTSASPAAEHAESEPAEPSVEMWE